MELIYLWVEKYKNIENQGFIFSPRFKCEYDEKTKKINIKVIKDYVNIFPDNINITAIVGENGSGKSSIIKLILMLIFFKKYYVTSCYDNEIKTLKRELKGKALFLIINTADGHKKICLNTDIYNDSITEVNNENIDFYSIYFSYMLDTLQNKKDYWMWNLYHKSDNYETPILLTPNKFHKDFLQNSINLDDIEYVNIKHSIKFYKKNIETKINDFFNPNVIKLHSDNPSTIQKVEFNFFGKVARKFLDLYKEPNEKHDKDSKNLDNKIKSIKEFETKKEYKKINLLYIAFKILSSPQSNFNKKVYDSVKEWFGKKLHEDDFLEEGITLIKSNIEKIFIEDTIKYNNEKINDCIKFYKNVSNKQEEILNNLLDRKKIKLSDFDDMSIISVPWLDLELLEDNKSFNSLSGGQKLFFTFIVNMMYQVSNLMQEDKYKTINLFFDEVEVSYHPNWQKEFIKNILKALENIGLGDKKINLFFSTHSPFILSDLPKENVIFLEKYKEDENQKVGNCKVSNQNIEQTFGANIHTLLSHGFFMKDGLMGEFAKGKIMEIKNFYELINRLKKRENFKKKNLWKQSYERRRKRFENIQKIIGEPFLKQIIKNYLDELDILFNGKKEFLTKKRDELNELLKEYND